MNWKKNISIIIGILVLMVAIPARSQVKNRVATTAASFLEIGIGSAGSAMGEAYVSMARDLTSIYWNPAGLGLMDRNGILVIHQPWIAGTNCTFFGTDLVLPSIGALALGVDRKSVV